MGFSSKWGLRLDSFCCDTVEDYSVFGAHILLLWRCVGEEENVLPGLLLASFLYPIWEMRNDGIF